MQINLSKLMMTTNSFSILLISALIFQCSLLGLVHSFPVDKTWQEVDAAFKAIDLNNDGGLTMAELKAARQKIYKCAQENAHKDGGYEFKLRDTNRDGELQFEEFLAMAKDEKPENISVADVKANFNKIDMNGDGFITPEEFLMPYIYGLHKEESEMDAAFKLVDLDGDNKLTDMEVMIMFADIGNGGKAMMSIANTVGKMFSQCLSKEV